MWSPEFHLQILETFGRGHLEFGFLHILENLKGFTPQRRRNGSSLGHPDESTRDRPTPSGRDGRTSPLNAIVQPEDGMPQRPIVADCNEHLIASTGNLASLSWWFFFWASDANIGMMLASKWLECSSERPLLMSPYGFGNLHHMPDNFSLHNHWQQEAEGKVANEALRSRILLGVVTTNYHVDLNFT